MKTATCLFAVSMLVTGLTLSPDLSAKVGAKTKINFHDIPNKEAMKNWPKPRPAGSGSKLLFGDVSKFTPGSAITTKTTAKRFDEVAKSTGVNFRSALLYSYSWDEDYPAYGVYDFSTADSPFKFTKKYVNYEAPQNGGGFFVDDKYYFTSYVMDDWGWDYDVTTYIVNTNTWKVDEKVTQDLYALATDLAYDPIEKVAFGCFYSDADEGSYWGYMDPSDCAIHQIKALDGQLVAVAIDETGNAYAITDSGVLAKVDKYSGELTSIGATGITPAYMQSATFSEDGTLYWAAGFTDGSTGLFTVDITNGHVSLVNAFDDEEEVVSLYALPAEVNANAPAAAKDLVANFTADQLEGTLSFNVPNATASGATLTGNVSYAVSIDGKDYTSGTAAAGAAVSVNVKVGNAGVHVFAVKLGNDAGESAKASTSLWVGIDRPSAVTDLTLTKVGDYDAKLTWTAPTEAVNGGYFDIARVSYTVTRLSDNKVVASGLKATEFTDKLTLDGQTYVTYKVTAYADDVEGQSAKSNGVVFGAAYNTPVTFKLDTEDEYNLFTVIDNNETINQDSGMWEYSPSAGCAGYVAGTKDGDDWFITPAVNLKSDRYYTFEYDVCCYSDYWPDQYEVFMGKAATIEAMTDQIVESTTIYWDEYRHVSVRVKVAEDGVYNFGFHALSDAGGAFFLIDNVAVNDSYGLKAPAAVTDLDVVAGDKGALNATVSFKAPVKTVDESTLSEITAVNVYCNEELIGSVDNVKPGESYSFTDNKPAQGNNTYKVVPVNNSGEGVAAEKSVWVGVDYPSAPEVLVSVKDAHPVITWTAPEGRGYYGGYVDNSNLTYIVYRVSDGSILAKDLTTFSYTDTETTIPTDGDQAIYQYAVYGQSTTGVGYPGSAFVFGGEKYSMPYEESFANGSTKNLWIMSATDDDNWQIADDWSATPQDEDGGLLMLTPYTAGSESSIFTGKIDMTKAKTPTLSFYLSSMSYQNNGFIETNPEDDTLDIEVAGADYKLTTIKTIHPSEYPKGEYTLVEVPLDQFAGQDFVFFGFRAHNVSAQTPMLIDNIKLRSNYDYNLMLTNVEAPASVNVTEDFNVNFTVKNDGVKTAENFDVTLYKGSEQVASTTEASLEHGASKDYSFKLTAESTWADSESFRIEVKLNGDEVADDNVAEFDVNVIRPNMPAVSDLDGTQDADGTYTFKWSAPEISDVEVVTDSFEDYAHGALRNFGEWSVIDEDGEYGFGDFYAGDDYVDLPHPFNAQAFTVLDATRLDIDLEKHPEWAAHSGDKMLACLYNNWENDDWLISPRLSGKEQVISFYAKTPDATKGDQIRVYYSADGKDTSDFALLDARKITLNSEWTKYEYTVPEETTYFAIRYSALSGCAVLIDDVTFEKAAAEGDIKLEVLGYNIYRDDTRLNENIITDTQYTVKDALSGEYSVTVVYNAGESEKSNKVNIISSGVDNIAVDKQDTNVIYDLLGRRVASPHVGQIYIINGKKMLYKK
jgi:hypothetical protein